MHDRHKVIRAVNKIEGIGRANQNSRNIAGTTEAEIKPLERQ